MILMGTPFLKIMLVLKIFVESELEVGLLRVTYNNKSRSRAQAVFRSELNHLAEPPAHYQHPTAQSHHPTDYPF